MEIHYFPPLRAINVVIKGLLASVWDDPATAGEGFAE